MRLDGARLGHDPEDPRFDPVLLKDKIHDYIGSKDPDALDKSHTWWDSTPVEMLAANYVATTRFLSAGALLDSQGKGETGKTKKVLKVKVGAIDRIRKELKHLDTSKQVSKHRFPQD